MNSSTNNLKTVIAKLQNLSSQQQQQVLEFVELLAAQSPQSSSPDRIAGLHPGAIKISDDFDDPLPDEFWTSGNLD